MLTPKRTISLSSSLALLVAALVLPLVVATVAFLYDDYQRSRADLVHSFGSSAHSLVMAIDREFVGAMRAMRALSGSPNLKLDELPAFHHQARAVLPGHFIQNILLLDAGGRVRMSTDVAFGMPQPRTAHPVQQAQVSRVLASGETDISDLFYSPAFGQHMTSLAVPVSPPDGGDRYVLIGEVSYLHIQKLLEKRRIPSDRILVITDASGNVVARTEAVESVVGKQVRPDVVQRLGERNEDLFESVRADGTAVLTAFVRSDNSRWSVVVGMPVKSVTAKLRHSLWTLGGLALLLLGSGLALAALVGRKISGSIGALTAPALTLGYGKAVVVPALSIREADEVGQAITKASAMLADAGTALAASEARMRGILESAMDAIITVDEDHRIVLYNRSAERIFGWSLQQVLGVRLEILMPERFRAGHPVHIQHFSATHVSTRNKTAGVTLYGLRANGEEFPLEASISQVDEAGGRLYSVILRDITVRMRAYEALERSNLDLQQFAYVASHDLKTPLRSIGGFVQLLERNYAHKLDDKALELIRRTSNAVQRLEQLTEDLLSYARVSSKTRPFTLVDSRAVAEDAIQLLDASIRDAGAVVTLGDMPTILCDRTQLVQLLLNLIGNGIKYCRDRVPEVHVSSARLNEREWVFSVKDNGIGIDLKHHNKVFEIFKRLHTTQEYVGTGIGLAVCRRVVERHGGKIWIDSEPGRGSTFYFTIPDTCPQKESHPS